MRLRLQRERGRHRVGRRVTTTRSTDAARRVRTVAVVVVAALGLAVAAAVMPVQSTLASFTDEESATSAPLTAATLPTVNNLKCTARWAVLSAPWVELNWADLKAGTLLATEYEISVTSGRTVLATRKVTGTTAQVSLSDLKMMSSGEYTILVKAKSNSAPGWTSIGGDTATFSTVWLLDGLNTCS